MFRMIEVTKVMTGTWIIPVRYPGKPKFSDFPEGKLESPVKKPLGLDVDMDDHTQDWYNDEDGSRDV